jgi:hypothetical protein
VYEELRFLRYKRLKKKKEKKKQCLLLEDFKVSKQFWVAVIFGYVVSL